MLRRGGRGERRGRARIHPKVSQNGQTHGDGEDLAMKIR
jgi:hypothetical protein